MAYSVPTADFVATTLQAQLSQGATSGTIGTGLNIPATNGILQVSYDSSNAVGAANGPETISYATYTTGTGALTGIVRGLAGTTDVLHDNGAKVSAGYSSAHLATDAATTWTANASTFSYSSVDGPTSVMTVGSDVTSSIYPGVRIKAQQAQALTWYMKLENATNAVGGYTIAEVGTPTYTAGKFNNALTLNGSSQCLSITDHADLKPTDEFTLGMWFKTNNTGADKMLFQSRSVNTNYAGLGLYVSAGNVLAYSVGNNTGASNFTLLTGTTTVTDNAWHYAVVSHRDNWTQVYLDGKLEVSGYTLTPAYAATNYVRIGCSNVSGANAMWHNGQIDDFFFINGYALDEQTIAAKYAASAEQGTGNLTLTKYFLCTASSYSAPNTTITMYGGTDHMLTNATISNVYYSSVKAPLGFPLGKEKWSVYFSDSTDRIQATPTVGTWYNISSLSISIPIGKWEIGAKGAFLLASNSATNQGIKMTLSTTNNSEAWPEITWTGMSNATTWVSVPGCGNKTISFASKTIVYPLANASESGVATGNLYFRNSVCPMLIRATSTLL